MRRKPHSFTHANLCRSVDLTVLGLTSASGTPQSPLRVCVAVVHRIVRARVIAACEQP
jgi:hypothetical protein